MTISDFQTHLRDLFADEIEIRDNLIIERSVSVPELDQIQTRDIFSDKWSYVEQTDARHEFFEMQMDWFLRLYGFRSEIKLAEFLKNKRVILDAGCGMGYKSSWFARLAPDSVVIGIDISDAALIAARNYGHHPNLFFLQGDIANTGLKDDSVDFVVCDQVIMHTEKPEETFRHLSDITKPGGEFACYVYAKKALPRELIDDYFRGRANTISPKEMWEFAAQLTELGKRLAELQTTFNSPDIPLLGIKAGEYDVQRFIYWNFLKCFWNAEWGFEMSKATNYDWYAPSNAKRYTREEFEKMIEDNNLVVAHFHEEEACYAGRFVK